MTGGSSPDVAHTLILGVGNPLMADDGVGVRAVEQLQARIGALPPGVDVIDGGTQGLGLIPVIETYRRLIIVDAVPMDLPAGTIQRFGWDEAQPISHARALSLHHTDLTDALVLADALGSLPPDVIIFGVQPAYMDWDQPMSQPVERALPDLVEALLSEVRREPEND
jgi:hydrogenase maturation protease